MAGRKKRGLPGETPDDLTIDHYQRACHHFIGGSTPNQICRLVGLSRSQLHHLWTFGLRSRGRVAAQPPIMVWIAEQLAATRVAGAQAAAEVSVRGVRVLGQAFEIAERAQAIVDMLLRLQQERLEAELAKPVDQRLTSPTAILSSEAMALLRTLRGYADVSRPTAAFRNLFDSHPVDPMAYRQTLPTDALDTEAREKLPAALALLDELGGSSQAAFMAEVAKEMQGWTTEELDEYAKGGPEPAAKR